ncbi:hypothetical protein ACMHYB_58015 [Sorangium sp. So ce1128]
MGSAANPGSSSRGFRCALEPISAHGVQEPREAHFGGVLGELDIGPSDDVTERTVPERPARPLRRLQVVLGDPLDHRSPLSL